MSEVFMECCARTAKLDAFIAELGIAGAEVQIIPPHEGVATDDEIKEAGDMVETYARNQRDTGENPSLNPQRFRANIERRLREGSVLVAVVGGDELDEVGCGKAISRFKFDK